MAKATVERDGEMVPVDQTIGLHDLRHFYASLLIQHKESVKVVQARLGHASAVETLDTYGHLWEGTEDATRDAVQDVLGGGVVVASGRVGRYDLTSATGPRPAHGFTPKGEPAGQGP